VGMRPKDDGYNGGAGSGQGHDRAPKGTIILRQDHHKQTHRARTQAAMSAKLSAEFAVYLQDPT
jgi:hypothetical protein